LGVRVEDIYHHVDPGAVPEIAGVLEWLAEKYPQTLAAVGDVDRSLIWEAMEESPLQRLAHSAQMARFYERLSEQVRERDRQTADASG
jgi:glutathione S-transferase